MFVYAYHICLCFRTNYGFFVLISFIINSPLQFFLYHVVGTCDDREPLFMGAEGQQ